MSANRSAIPNRAEAIPPRQNGRQEMFRHSLLAIAASLMTLATFSGTVAILGSGGSATSQVA